MEVLQIINCTITDMIGRFDNDDPCGLEPKYTTTCAAITVQNMADIEISDCTIDLQYGEEYNYSRAAQTDGIYLGGVNFINVHNNTILLRNDFTTHYDYPGVTTADQQPHIDGIQIAPHFEAEYPTVYCGNILISKNTVSNLSIIDASIGSALSYANRQGIYAEQPFGYCEIKNNLVRSARGNNLINVSLNGTTDHSYIFNNTLIGEDQQFLATFKTNGTQNVSKFQIKNNIFYKDVVLSTNPLFTVFFDGITSLQMLTGILNNNLHFINISGAVPRILFSVGDAAFSSWDQNGINSSPNFTNTFNDDYTLQYNSPAINKGILISSITEDRANRKRPYWVGGTDIGAYEYSEAQLRFGHEQVSGSVSHTITALGTYWKKNGSTWVITNESDMGTSSYTFSQNVSTPKEAWNGFRFKWMLNPDEVRPMGHAFYKISNLNNYFYLDLRDITTEYNPNVYIRFVGVPYPGRYQYYAGSDFINISEGEVLRVWNLAGTTISQTNLPSYLDHMLIGLEELNKPRLVWGPVNAELELHRHNGTSWSLFRTYTSEEIMDIDETVDIAIYKDTLIKYRLNLAECPECSTNTVQYYVTEAPEKRNVFEEKESIYSLSQNYPNPFNPTTSISFNIPKMENVIIKLYNILGKEVQTLVNESLAPGSYKIQYNGKELASGIYFYSITAGTYNEVKKMQILK